MRTTLDSILFSQLSGPNWGLLPACLFLPWLASPQGASQGGYILFILFALLMASHDLVTHRIPNPLNALAAICGLTAAALYGGAPALGQALLGGLTAFGLMAIFFFLGAVGAGDVKAMGALGTFLGPWGGLELFLLTVLAGGVLAVLRLLMAGGLKSLLSWRTSGRGLTMPYGLAICAGALIRVAVQGCLR